jgi:hypothetical protein
MPMLKAYRNNLCVWLQTWTAFELRRCRTQHSYRTSSDQQPEHGGSVTATENNPQPSDREQPVAATPAAYFSPAEHAHNMLESPLTGEVTEEAGAQQLPEVHPHTAPGATVPEYGRDLTTSPPASYQLLRAAAVVPYWHVDGFLRLKLPQQLADACVGLQLEIGGVLLPRACTQQLTLRRAAGHGPCSVYEVTGLKSKKSLLNGAQLLPCRAVPSEDSLAEQANKRSPT